MFDPPRPGAETACCAGSGLVPPLPAQRTYPRAVRPVRKVRGAACSASKWNAPRAPSSTSLSRARPTPGRPLATKEEWVCRGLLPRLPVPGEVVSGWEPWRLRPSASPARTPARSSASTGTSSRPTSRTPRARRSGSPSPCRSTPRPARSPGRCTAHDRDPRSSRAGTRRRAFRPPAAARRDSAGGQGGDAGGAPRPLRLGPRRRKEPRPDRPRRGERPPGAGWRRLSDRHEATRRCVAPRAPGRRRQRRRGRAGEREGQGAPPLRAPARARWGGRRSRGGRRAPGVRRSGRRCGCRGSGAGDREPAPPQARRPRRPSPGGSSRSLRRRGGDRARPVPERRAGQADVHPAAALRARRRRRPDPRPERGDGRAHRADRPVRSGLVPPRRDRRRAGLDPRHALGLGRAPRRLRSRSRHPFARTARPGGRRARGRPGLSDRRVLRHLGCREDRGRPAPERSRHLAWSARDRRPPRALVRPATRCDVMPCMVRTAYSTL